MIQYNIRRYNEVHGQNRYYDLLALTYKGRVDILRKIKDIKILPLDVSREICSELDHWF